MYPEALSSTPDSSQTNSEQAESGALDPDFHSSRRDEERLDSWGGRGFRRIECGHPEEFSESGLQLRKWLIRDMADRVLLSEVAALEGWDLEAAIEELGSLHLLDESDPHFWRLVSQRTIETNEASLVEKGLSDKPSNFPSEVSD